MALEFAEFLRDFVPFGVGGDIGVVSEETMLGELVTGKKSVLEIFCGSTLAAGLRSRSCRVEQVSLDDFVAADSPSKRGKVKSSYDVILLSDVLAHYREPVTLLRKCGGLLNRDGFIVAAMPNSGYGPLRLAMLAGTYDGLAAHHEGSPRLHSFTFDGVESVLRRAGFGIEKTLRRSVPWDVALNEAPYNAVDDAIVRQIRRDPENATVTFVIKAVPLVYAVKEAPAREDAVAALQLRLDAAESELQAATALNTELREAGRTLRAQIADLRRRAGRADQMQAALNVALQDLSAAISTRDELLRRIHSADFELVQLAERERELERSMGALRQQNAELAKTRTEVERSVHSLQQQNAALAKTRTELQRSIEALHQQNAAIGKRAEGAEQTALNLANELLQRTKVEVQELSDLIETVQRSGFWRVKHALRGLRRLLFR